MKEANPMSHCILSSLIVAWVALTTPQAVPGIYELSFFENGQPIESILFVDDELSLKATGGHHVGDSPE
jgi:hypothetical protein